MQDEIKYGILDIDLSFLPVHHFLYTASTGKEHPGYMSNYRSASLGVSKGSDSLEALLR